MPTVLITGASRGIGRRFADLYRAQGWRVVATCRDPVAAALEGEVHRLDVTDADDVARLTTAMAEETIDVLINNAGIAGPRGYDLPSVDYEAWDQVLRTNAIAPVRVANALRQQVLRSARRQFVFISSLMGSIEQTRSSDSIIYRSSKACLNAAVNVLSQDLGPEGATCVLFHPGWVRTDMGGPSAAIDVQVSVASMMNVIDRLTTRDNGRFLNYDGFDIPW